MRTQYVQTTSEFAGQRMPLDVLVVDENSNDLEYHAELFEKLGLRVFRCASYQAAIYSILRGRTFDLAVVKALQLLKGRWFYDIWDQPRRLWCWRVITAWTVIARLSDLAQRITWKNPYLWSRFTVCCASACESPDRKTQ